MGSKRGFVLQLLAALVVTGALLGAIELLAGLAVRDAAPPPTVSIDLTDDTVSRTLEWLEINPAPLVRDVDLLWRNEPSARKTQPVNPRAYGRNASWTVETNSEGYRGPERRAADGTGVYRILCVGDSITFGFNVDQGGTYPRQLERLLAERHPGMRLEVVNAGVPGWSWLQGLRFLETRGMAMQPDLVVIGHGTNDQLATARITDEERFRRLEGRWRKAVESLGLWLARTNTYQAVTRLVPAQNETASQHSPGCRAQMAGGGRCHRVSLAEIEVSVHEVGEVVRDGGAALLVVNLDFVGTAAVHAARAATERDDIPFVDAVARMEALRRVHEDRRARRLGLAPARTEAAPDEGAPRPAKHVVLRVVAPAPGGAHEVAGGAYFQQGFAFAAPMVDDGTGGDERAGDGIFSATVAVPPHVGAIEYMFHRDGVPEFAPLPPLASTLGSRMLPVPGDAIGPVEVFGEALFMAERAHPSAEGHRVIARLIAERIEQMPSFRKRLATHAAAGSR